MESSGYKHCRFETRDVPSDPLQLDYIATIFITYTLSHFFGNFAYRIGRKMSKK